MLSAGQRLGRFEILGPLGTGGMGEVYRAQDLELQREVAVKVLPAEFSRDAERQRRFELEARAAASLTHPNVVAVHEVGVHDGIGFIVTELLQGQSLRRRLNGRPLPAHKAVEYAIQIASGLAAGHDRGIVHRDIKPDNIFVTSEGRIKILDFGIAKRAGAAAPHEATVTLTADGTAAQTIVGTPGYMSPEQARGLNTDHRSDIFSLGVVLYEMLAGFAPFRRETATDTLSAILHDEPPELAGAGLAPPGLERVVRHCLEKRVEERFQHARDVIFSLESLEPVAGARHATTGRGLPLGRRVLAALTLGTAVAAAAAGYVVGRSARAPEQDSPGAYAVHRVTEFPGLEEAPAISPDRKWVAFTADLNGRRQVFVRLLAGGPSLPVTQDPIDHQFPRWLPDASTLVFFAAARPGEVQGAIHTVSALGGPSRRVMPSIGGADVARNGRLASFRLADGGVQLVSAAPDGTDVQVIARSVAGYCSHARWSPDGRWIAFQQGDGVRNDVFVVPALGGEPRRLTNDRNIINGVAWLPDSSGVVYGSSRDSTLPYLPALSLWEARLDAAAPRRLTPSDVWYEQPDVHADGMVTAVRKRLRFDILQIPFDRDPADNVRRAVTVTRQTGQVLTPTAAPDGDEIAYLSDSGGHANIWIASRTRGNLRQITFETDPSVALGVPIWSPDGKAVAFVSSKGNTGLDFGVWLVDPDGSNLRNLVARGLGVAWSPDGQWLYFVDSSAAALKKVAVTGGAPVTVRAEPVRNVIGLHGTTIYYMMQRMLIDGRPEFAILAATPEDGPSRVVAQLPPSRVPSWQIVNPALSPDGEWLALPLTDGVTTNIWAVSTGSGEWRQVTDFGDRVTFIARRLSWSADGRSLLASVGEGEADIVVFDGLIEPPRR